MRRLTCVLVAAAALVSATAASAADALSVNVDRSRIETKLGHKFSFHTTVTNREAAVSSGYVAHLNVLSYGRGVYVDPEDWSGERTRYLPPIPAGGSARLTWRMQAVNAGTFAVYVAVLPQQGSAGRPTTGPAIRVLVGKRTTLNAQGILPLALGVPALLGFAWLGLRVRHRRGSPPSHPTDLGSTHT